MTTPDGYGFPLPPLTAAEEAARAVRGCCDAACVVRTSRARSAPQRCDALAARREQKPVWVVRPLPHRGNARCRPGCRAAR